MKQSGGSGAEELGWELEEDEELLEEELLDEDELELLLDLGSNSKEFPPCRAARRVAFFHLLVEVDQGQHGFSLLVGRRGVCQQVVVQIGLTFLVAYQGNAELLLGVLGRLVLVDDTAPVVSLVKMDLAVEGSERAGLRGQC